MGSGTVCAAAPCAVSRRCGWHGAYVCPVGGAVFLYGIRLFYIRCGAARGCRSAGAPHAAHQPTGILSLHRTVCKIAGYHKEKRHRPPGKHTHRATHIAGKRHMEQQHKQCRYPFEQVKCSVPQNASSFICKYEETALQCKTVIW